MTSGSTPVAAAGLLDNLLDDTGSPAAHRDHRGAWYGDTLAALVLDAATIEQTTAQLGAADHARPVLLSGSDRHQVRAARDLIAEDDRVELIGVRLPLPEAGPDARVSRAETTARLLAALDFTAPAWIEIAPGPGWAEALSVIAADGAEGLTLVLDDGPDQAAALLDAAVSHRLRWRLGGPELPLTSPPTAPTDHRYGVLNVLAAVRAALEGASRPDLARVLAEPDPAPVVASLRALTEADAARLRTLCVAVQADDVEGTIAELVRLGLIAPDD